jgi:3-hydroxyacyl-[acyl-carrier-protein] dehydratase
LNKKTVIKYLPYQSPFLFVDELTYISENRVTGNYTFKQSDYFYRGHFKDNPITPGVILTEVMAQIGVVCLGIYLLREKFSDLKKPQLFLTSNNIDFFYQLSRNKELMWFLKKYTLDSISLNVWSSCLMRKTN